MNTRIEGTGNITPAGEVMIATDACKKCGKRGVKLQRCGACKRVCCESLLRIIGGTLRLDCYHYRL